MPELNDLLPMLGLIAVIGAFAGMIAGLLGVGGGIFLVPTFFFAFERLGYTTPDLMQICLATSLATIVGDIGALAHQPQSQGGGGLGDPEGLGARHRHRRGSGRDRGHGSAERGPDGDFRHPRGHGGRSTSPSGGRTGAWAMRCRVGLGRAVTSPVIGFLSVLMGIGGGSFGVPLMTLYGVAIHRAVATAAGFGVIIAVPGVIGFLLVQGQGPDRPPFTIGQVNLVAFAVVVAMTVLTAPIGARLAHATDPGRCAASSRPS
jgi:uncharacterized membrane protein YfcA